MRVDCTVAVITGGASGLGRLHAILLADQQVKVAILDVDKKGLEETATQSENIFAYNCDVTQLTQVEQTVESIERELGPIDRLISCAAIMPGGELMQQSAEKINQIMSINYMGMVNICQSVIPKMLHRDKGEVVIYGSTAGRVKLRKFGGYGASKAANNFYTRVLMKEHKDSSLKFQLVCPAAVDTPLIDQAKDSGPGSLKHIQESKRFLSNPQKVVESVEKCLRSGKEINYPGPAIWVKLLYPILPGLVEWMTERE